MKKNEEKQKEFRRLLNIARLAGVCSTQKDFAYFVGMDEQTISNANRGDAAALTKNFFTRIENAFREAGIDMSGASIGGDVTQQVGADNSIETSMPPTPAQDATGKLIAELTAQREMFDKQMSIVLAQNSQLISIITRSVK